MDWSYSREFRSSIFNRQLSSLTIKEQVKTEKLVEEVYYQQKDILKENYLKLFKLIHISFAKSNLYNLPSSYESLDASQTWLIYWNVHSLSLLNFSISDDLKTDIINDISSCQNPKGGFGGGPYQLSHMATTYASVMALIELKSSDGLSIINKASLYDWLMKTRLDNGAFIMHEGGEVDVRGCYCAVTVAKVTGIYTDELFRNTANWIASCQTYEGGFAGAPGLEAHGGYTFCALAALILLDAVHLIDLERLLRWSVNRQMANEGGFQGRTNKLVDSCYTFWVGALFPLLQSAINSSASNNFEFDGPLFDSKALREYVIVCCQRLNPPYHNPNGGGFIDKPGKNADPYHTCYSLSGIAVSQLRVGDQFSNDLETVDPIFNVTRAALDFCNEFYAN